jgi:hypothetical protein
VVGGTNGNALVEAGTFTNGAGHSHLVAFIDGAIAVIVEVVARNLFLFIGFGIETHPALNASTFTGSFLANALAITGAGEIVRRKGHVFVGKSIAVIVLTVTEIGKVAAAVATGVAQPFVNFTITVVVEGIAEGFVLLPFVGQLQVPSIDSQADWTT